MLHIGILPSHARWSDFLLRLRYVVVDELHTLRGVFGSHVAHVLRRLRRLGEHYGSAPSFCFASATIGNPAELAVGALRPPGHGRSTTTARRAARGASRSGSDRCSTSTPGARASANVETARVLARFVADGHPTLAFTRSRRGRRARRVATPATCSRDLARGGRTGRVVPGRATSPESGASSNARCPTGRCSASRRRTRSSSASTSARSTPSSSTASRARSRRSGNRSAGPDAAPGERPRCSSRATTSSTSGTPRTPTSCSAVAPRRRW